MRIRSRSARMAAVALALAVGAAACTNKQSDNASTGGGAQGGSGGSAGTAAGGGKAFTIDTSKCDNPGAATEPVSGNDIKLGSSFPQSGIYAPFAEISKGWQAFLKNQNQNGGINGKQLSWVTKDDGYDPAKTKTNVNEMIDSDKVFTLFNNVGTPNNLSIRADLNKQCVPNLYTATGSQLMGNPTKYPWVIGSIPSYATEAAVFADYLKKNKPNAKVGILRQNDDFGEGYLDAFKIAIDGAGITIVGTETYDAGQSEVTSQITKLNGAGADTLLLAVTTTTCPNAMKAVSQIQGWNPLSYASATCASKVLLGLAGPAANGVLTGIYLKQPADPQWANDPAMQKYKSIGAANGLSEQDLENTIVAYGWTMGDLLTQTFQKAPSLSRKDVMETAYNLQNVTAGLLLPGMTINTNGAKDPYPIEQLAIGKWNGNYFEQQGELINYEGKTIQYVKPGS